MCLFLNVLEKKTPFLSAATTQPVTTQSSDSNADGHVVGPKSSRFEKFPLSELVRINKQESSE